jgi:hypothetical protein
MDALPRSAADERDRIRDFQRYEHMKPFDALRCRVVSDSPEDLPARVDELLSNHAHYAERCARAAAELATAPLADAPRRAVRALTEVVHRG